MPGPRARGRRGRGAEGWRGAVRGKDRTRPRRAGSRGRVVRDSAPRARAAGRRLGRRPRGRRVSAAGPGLGAEERAAAWRGGEGAPGRGWGEGTPGRGSRRAGDREYGPRGPGVAAGAQPATPARPPLCRGRDPVGSPRMRRVATLGGGVRAAGRPVWSRRARPPPPAPSVLNDASPGRVPTGRLRAGSVVRRPFLKPPEGLGGQR